MLCEDALGAPDAVLLEAGQVDAGATASLLLDLGAVALPEHAQVDEIGAVRQVASLVDAREVELGGVLPTRPRTTRGPAEPQCGWYWPRLSSLLTASPA